jgi:hypothetical protein
VQALSCRVSLARVYVHEDDVCVHRAPFAAAWDRRTHPLSVQRCRSREAAITRSSSPKKTTLRCGTGSAPERAIGAPFSLPHLHYPLRTAGDDKKGRMRAPSCRLHVLLHAGMCALSRYFPGFGFLLCPGGTPGPELEHTPPSWSVHFVPLGAVHASALGAVAPTNTAAPRTTPRRRFFMRCPPLLCGHLPLPLRPAPPHAYPLVGTICAVRA